MLEQRLISTPLTLRIHRSTAVATPQPPRSNLLRNMVCFLLRKPFAPVEYWYTPRHLASEVLIYTTSLAWPPSPVQTEMVDANSLPLPATSTSQRNHPMRPGVAPVLFLFFTFLDLTSIDFQMLKVSVQSCGYTRFHSVTPGQSETYLSPKITVQCLRARCRQIWTMLSVSKKNQSTCLWFG
jgi:hypothetical protein